MQALAYKITYLLTTDGLYVENFEGHACDIVFQNFLSFNIHGTTLYKRSWVGQDFAKRLEVSQTIAAPNLKHTA